MIVRTKARAAVTAVAVAGALAFGAAMASPASAGTAASATTVVAPSTSAAQPAGVLAHFVLAPISTAARANPQASSLPEIDCNAFANDPLWWPAGSNPSFTDAVMEGPVAANCFYVADDEPAVVGGIRLTGTLLRQGIVQKAKVGIWGPTTNAALSVFANCVGGGWNTEVTATITPPPGYEVISGPNPIIKLSDVVDIGAC